MATSAQMRWSHEITGIRTQTNELAKCERPKKLKVRCFVGIERGMSIGPGALAHWTHDGQERISEVEL